MLKPSFRIELRVPGETGHLRGPRLVAASTATMLGYDIDGLWDVRCAVDELCGVLLKAGCPRLDLVFEDDPPTGGLVVHGAGRPASAGNGDAPGTVDELAADLLDAVTASWELRSDGQAIRFDAGFRPPGDGELIPRSNELSQPR